MMTLRQRILLHYSVTLSLSLVIVGFWSWFEFNEQRDEAIHGGADAALKHDPLAETFEILLYGGLPAILLGILGGGLLMRSALHPIEKLTKALETTDVSNLSNPEPRSGNGDELDRMTAVFNRMKERLGLSFTLAREFTLNASHELKTPLTVIPGTLEQMATNEQAAVVDRERAASLLEEVQRLSSIVGQLSFLARADAGLLPSARESVALDGLVRDLVEETMILGSGAEIFVMLGACQPVSVSGDKMRLRQLLLNLADNAVKYNEHGGSIEMTLVRQNEDAVFTIINTGTELPVELRGRVFERFFRGDLAHNSAIEGSGLGLSIATSIVEVHQGVIDYSVLPDRRTQVVVKLPSLR